MNCKPNIIKKAVYAFKDSTIRKKLLLSYFILFFMPLGLLIFISYVYVSRVYENQFKYTASQSFDQAYTLISYKVDALIKASDIIYFNSDVQTILSRSENVYESDIVQQNIDMMNLDRFLSNMKNTKDVYRASLYVPGWFTYSNQGIYFMNIDTFSDTESYKKLIKSREKVSWTLPHTITNNISSYDDVSVISLLRKIRNSEQINEFIGIIKLSILESNIQVIIVNANITRDGVVYLQNSDGVVISSSNADNLLKIDPDQDIGKMTKYRSMSWETVTIGSSNFAVTSRAVENTDWTLITVIPFSEIMSQSNKIRDLMIIIGVIVCGLAYFISTSTVKRIILLMKKMKKVQEGDLEVSIASKSQDEIGKLMDSFNYMVKRISLLEEEQYQSGKEIKNLELKALQAQINPHFLYNTLEIINWKAIDNNVPEIAVIAKSLAKFYKLSLNKGRDIVSIEDEVNHIKNYVQIQNIRFDNRIKLTVDIGETIYRYSILKIILQPIVENSILHGILESRDRQEGEIRLGGRIEQNEILLTVHDDGIGMTEEKVAGILTAEVTNEPHGYGVRNINHRIKLCYGQQYGLTYHSSPGTGTLVEIKIPAEKSDEHI